MAIGLGVCRTWIRHTLVLGCLGGALCLGPHGLEGQAQAAVGSTYFVATGGSDSNDCLSAESPCLTIQAAIDKASAGDTVQVAAGTYVENLSVTKQVDLACANAGIPAGWNAGVRGTESTIRGEANISAAGTVIDGCSFNRPDVAASAVPRLIESVGVGGTITVKNSIMDLQRFNVSPTTAGCGAAIAGTAAWRIYDNGINNQRYSTSTCTADAYSSRAIFAEGAQPIEVDGNKFVSSSQFGVYLTGSTPAGSTVTNNVFNGGQGVTVGIPSGVKITGNSFIAGNAIYLDSTPNAEIRNNLFCGGQGGGTEDPNFPQCAGLSSGRLGFSIWSTGAQSGAVARDNAILGGYSIATAAPYGGRTIFNYSGNGLDLTGNWWGNGISPSAILAKTYQSPGAVTYQPNIAAYSNDPAKAGKPGFWPLVPEFQATTPVSASPVTVELTGFFTGSSVGITFTNGVTGAGVTSVTAYDPASDITTPYPQPPSGFLLGDPPTYFTITTTATVSGDRQVCMTIPEGAFPSSVAPTLYHYTGGAWTEVAGTSWDPDTRLLCGTVSSFSPFAAGAEPVAPSGTAPTLSGTARSGQTLSTDDGTWTGFPDSFTYSYQWQRCDSDGSDCTNVGSDQDSYALGSSDVGRKLKVTVTASNGVSPAGEATSALSDVVEGPAVSSAAPSISPASPQVGDTVLGDDGSWGGYPIPTGSDFSYQWQRSDTGSGGWADITGAESKDYGVGPGDIDKYLRLVVTADNGIGSSTSAASNTTGQVSPADSAPQNTAVPAISGTARSGQTLSTDDGTWTGFPDSFTYSYQWQRCDSDGSDCTNVGSDQDSYALGSSDVGRKLKVTVTASNGVSPAGEATSALTESVQEKTNPKPFLRAQGYAGLRSLRVKVGCADEDPCEVRLWGALKGWAPGDSRGHRRKPRKLFPRSVDLGAGERKVATLLYRPALRRKVERRAKRGGEWGVHVNAYQGGGGVTKILSVSKRTSE